MNLILFYADGTTFKFDQVSDLKVFEQSIEFTYFGASTQTRRRATFRAFVGYSIFTPE